MANPVENDISALHRGLRNSKKLAVPEQVIGVFQPTHKLICQKDIEESHDIFFADSLRGCGGARCDNRSTRVRTEGPGNPRPT
jgi:hypothetical protein